MDLFKTIKGKKILLIEDDESVRDSMKMFFIGEGIRIDTEETAEEGIQTLEKQRYDIIITDYRLPGMDGLMFLRQVHDLCPDSFKILMTAYGSRKLFKDAAALGVNEYIEKPFTAKLIRNALTRYKGKAG